MHTHSSLQFEIRPESPADIPSIYRVNELAFKRDSEARLVDASRESKGTTLSLVASVGVEIAGHILFAPMRIATEKDGDVPAVGLGPLAVLPVYQRRGIGGGLIVEGLARLKAGGHRICFVLGDEEYYPRFGFQHAEPLGLKSQWTMTAPVFMVLALTENALAGIKGTAFYQAGKRGR